jgi:hypothetical protein
MQVRSREEPKMKPQPLETLQVNIPTATPDAAEAGEISAAAAPNMAMAAAATRRFVFTSALLLTGDVRRRSEQHSALSAPSLIQKSAARAATRNLT